LLVAPDSDARIDVAGLVLAPYPITQQEGQFDLTLQLAELEGALAGAFKYNRDLFDASTIDRLQARYRALLEEIVANPEQRIDDWPLFEEAQQHATPADREEIEL
jgi:non-ribosomal peptide synthetase component F